VHWQVTIGVPLGLTLQASYEPVHDRTPRRARAKPRRLPAARANG
jgi:hypothetical protein